MLVDGFEMNRLFVATLALSICSLSSISRADNWGHWRGPTGNSTSPDANPPTEWSETKNIKWKVAVPGKSSGSPVIWGDRVFVVSAVPVGGGNAAKQSSTVRFVAQQQRRGQRGGRGGQGGRGGRGGGGPLPNLAFKILCFNRADGSLMWEKTATSATPHEGTHNTNTFASASPTTDGEHVYAHFGSRGLYCYTVDGEFKWKREFGKMVTRATFGEGSSPTIVDDMIIVPWDHEGPSALYALDKRTGKTIWKTDRDEPSCWATPLIVEHNGKKQIVMNGQNYARCYDLASGKELWKCDGQTDRPVASAVVMGDMAYVGSGYRGEFLAAFKLGGSGDIEGTQNVAWTIESDTPDIASPLLSGDRLYFHKGKSGMLSCVDAKTGKFHFQSQRLGRLGNIYASPVAAGGHIYLSDRNGLTVVIKDSQTLEIVATNSLGETIDATPAPVGNELFIRGENHLFCIVNK